MEEEEVVVVVEEVEEEEEGLIPPKANGMPVFIWAPDKGALIH